MITLKTRTTGGKFALYPAQTPRPPAVTRHEVTPLITKKMIITKSNYDYSKVKGQTFTMKSKTVPNQSMSLREILRRYVSGQPVTAKIRTAVPEELVEVERTKHMDPVDRDQVIKEKADWAKNVTEEAKRREAEDLAKRAKEKDDFETWRKEVSSKLDANTSTNET